MGDVMVNKEPWLAVNLSAFVPGLGHLYVGRYVKGVFIIFFFLLSIGMGCYSLYSTLGNVVVGICSLVVAVAITLYSMIDSHRSVRLNNSQEFEKIRKETKDSWLAVFLSRIIPGLCHFYKGNVGVGICFVILYIIILILLEESNFDFIILILSSFVFALASFHSYLLGHLYREASKRPIYLMMIAIFLFMIIKSLSLNLVGSFKVPSSSMQPTIQPGETVLTIKFYNHWLKRGDIIVFKFPEDRKKMFVKRLVGFAGETIEIKDGDIYINQKKLDDQFDHNIIYFSEGNWGVSGKPYKISEGTVFALGDNSENSVDSREYGPVPVADIIGRVYKVIMPFSAARPLKQKTLWFHNKLNLLISSNED